MPRRSRFDEADCWLHIMNRGLARRTVFETRDHVRYFLSRLAKSVRRKEIEVHAFSILTTHYHIFARSPRAAISHAMQRIQNDYVRWFNRRHRRDGPLFRGRFRSIPVRSETHMRNLLRYIDHNAPEARLALTGPDYPYGSARFYRADTGPRWLTRGIVEHVARGSLSVGQHEADAYHACFGSELPNACKAVIERRLNRGESGADPLDDLVGAAPERVARWMAQRAALADGTSPGPVVVSPDVIDACFDSQTPQKTNWTYKEGRTTYDLRIVAHGALLREAGALTWDRIAGRLGVSITTARKYHRIHRKLAGSDEDYLQRVGSHLARAFSQQYGSSPSRLDRPWHFSAR